ncbi:hypothetical protein LSAT2_006339 [Lamellibrachia satsuma]|nr:hypothetical protein LSAT2_006339 [Lamellibrachia satsuma]
MYVLFIAVYVSTLSTVCHSVYKAEQVTASQYSLEMVSKNESAQETEGQQLTGGHLKTEAQLETQYQLDIQC